MRTLNTQGGRSKFKTLGFVSFLLLVLAYVGNFIIQKSTLASSQSITAGSLNQTISLDFSTFLGTSGGSWGSLFESTFDSNGNIVVVGQGDLSPSGYPPNVPVRTFGSFADGDAILVAKLTPDGSKMLWATFLGGNGFDKGGYGIGLDGSDNIHITGVTHSTDFPTTPNAFDSTYNGGGGGAEIYLTKLSPDGSRLIYSTYLGGKLGEEAARGGLTVDNQGFAYVVGSTDSPDYLENASSGNPSNKVNAPIGGAEGIVTKVSIAGSEIVYSRYLGSPTNISIGEDVTGIRIDLQGNAYIAQNVWGAGASTTDGSTFNGGGSDTYLAKISPDGKKLLFAKYWGGNGDDGPSRPALDTQGNFYITGATTSTNFPVLNGRQPLSGGILDGFLAKFNSNGTLLFSTYIGGTDFDLGDSVGLGKNGLVFVTGQTKSSNFTVSADAYDPSYNGDLDVFFQIYDPSGQLQYSTYFGGPNLDRPRNVSPGIWGDPVLTGMTESANFPTTPSAFDTTFNGNHDFFVAKFQITTPPTPLANVSITGPTTGTEGIPQSFTVLTNPITATQPITYFWRSSNQPTVTTVNGLIDIQSFNWSITGTQTIRITATNSINVVSAAYSIDINPGHKVCLPIAIRGN